MELKGERHLAVDRAATWRALNDPAVLRACIPGCESIERSGDDEFQVAVVAALGPVKARFQGRIRLEDVVEPLSYTLRFEGQGGAAGFAKGAARVALEDEGPGTLLGYSVDAQVGGRLAQVGNRLIEPAALKLADDFFAAFEAQVGGAGAAATKPASPAKPPSTRYPAVAYGLVAAAIVLLLLLLLR
jgi:carbon monoxide dehydrogenase subunit G